MTTKPLIACIHLPPSLGLPGCPGWEEASDGLAADLVVVEDAGYDGILLENDNDKPHTLTVTKAQVAWIGRLCAFARERWKKKLGVGVQRIDWEASLAIAAANELDFVRLDTFVDIVRMQGEVVTVEPQAVRALRTALGAEKVELWTDVHVKHAELLDTKDLAASARAAIAEGSSMVLVSGNRSGEPPRAEDLQAAHAATAGWGAPVAIASGLDVGTVGWLAPLADAAVVGTALKVGPRVDPARAQEMILAWRKACGSLR